MADDQHDHDIPLHVFTVNIAFRDHSAKQGMHKVCMALQTLCENGEFVDYAVMTIPGEAGGSHSRTVPTEDIKYESGGLDSSWLRTAGPFDIKKE